MKNVRITPNGRVWPAVASFLSRMWETPLRLLWAAYKEQAGIAKDLGDGRDLPLLDWHNSMG